MVRLIASALFLTLFVLQAFSQCSKDTDCKGDRVCVDGACVDPLALAAMKTRPVPETPAVPGGISLSNSGFELGAALGLWMGGTVNVAGMEVDKDACSIFKLYLDGYLIPKLAFGVFFHFVPNMTSPDLDTKGSASSFEVGMAIRPRFFVEPRTALIPSLEIGYRNTTLTLEDIESAQDGMALNGNFEIEHAISKKVAVFGSFGFLAQPVGGDGDISYSFAPIFYLNFGFGFGSF